MHNFKKKLFWFVVLNLSLSLSSNLLAQNCYDKLLKSLDAQAYSVVSSNITYREDISWEDKIIKILDKFLKDQNCSDWINIKKITKSQIQCKKYFKQHEVCMVKTREAFFHIARDYVDSSTIIVNRWD